MSKGTAKILRLIAAMTATLFALLLATSGEVHGSAVGDKDVASQMGGHDGRH